MSSCFLCDCSYKLQNRDEYNVLYQISGETVGSTKMLMKQLPIMIGSSGIDTDDQQHDNNDKQNYVSYRVKKIEFRGFVDDIRDVSGSKRPDCVLIFKVPFRDPIIDYYFYFNENFILYSEPEKVLGYVMRYFNHQSSGERGTSENFEIYINRPFIVGPNDYVGVFYMFNKSLSAGQGRRVEASAKVWFDIV